MDEDLREEPLRCPRCGVENFAFASFCIACGKSLTESDDDFPESSQLISGAMPRAIPPARLSPGRLRMLETGIGLLVVLLVVGYALFNWRQSVARSDAYHDGQVAEQQMQWDAAAQSFGRAGDLKDAPQRMQAAEQKIAERNRLYEEARVSEATEQWANAVVALNLLQAVQPGYLDSTERLAIARQNAFSATLDGLVYLVGQGSAPGLYLRDSLGHANRLPGSDSLSLVRATDPSTGSLVYDRPVEPSDHCNDPSQPGLDTGGQHSRVAVLLTVDRDRMVSEQPLPCLDSAGTGQFDKQGLWWFNSGSSAASSSGEVYYRSNDPTLPAVRVSDGLDGNRVAALDLVHSRAVIVQSSTVPSIGSWQSRIVLAGSDGHSVQELDTVPGQVLQASVSTDGRWLVLVTQLNTARTEQNVLALALPPDSAPVRRKFTPTWPRGALQIGNALPVYDLNAAFLPSADGHARLAITHTSAAQASLVVYDLDAGSIVYTWDGSDLGGASPALAGFSGDGQTLVFRGQAGEDAALELLHLKPDGSIAASHLQVVASPEQRVQVLFPQGSEYALITIEGSPGSEGKPSLLYAATFASDGTVGPATLLAQPQPPGSPEAGWTTLLNGGGVLAYVDRSGGLHAVFLSGSADTQVAAGAVAVWSVATGHNSNQPAGGR